MGVKDQAALQVWVSGGLKFPSFHRNACNEQDNLQALEGIRHIFLRRNQQLIIIITPLLGNESPYASLTIHTKRVPPLLNCRRFLLPVTATLRTLGRKLYLGVL